VASICNLGFFGFGNMGQAIAGGLLTSGILTPRHMSVFDVSEDKQDKAAALGIHVSPNVSELAKRCDAIILAVKPQDMNNILDELKPHFQETTLIISIAAGISIAKVQDRLGSQIRVVRVMPNTPALVGAGAAGFAGSANCSEADAEITRTIFSAVGIAEMVSEPEIDAVTALSGSGPAYFFRLVELLVSAACAHGIDREQATRLAAQTLFGAGKLLQESGEDPETLRHRVTSKGGTTEAALRTFEELGLGKVVRAGFDAAAKRSKELGQ
jgi:pyrroline-5-carboxylate reductase